MNRRHVAAALLVFASITTIKCPCARLNACHKWSYFLSVGGATAIVWHDNA
tara:strand:- start:418 stop:570 length:153 start_codon:yes stop_codon:yes gene_type:complete